jgi:hypothetical protein
MLNGATLRTDSARVCAGASSTGRCVAWLMMMRSAAADAPASVVATVTMRTMAVVPLSKVTCGLGYLTSRKTCVFCIPSTNACHLLGAGGQCRSVEETSRTTTNGLTSGLTCPLSVGCTKGVNASELRT